ncbi:MAG: M1 family aminopeptidase [Moorella sp. (in: firmicutes)]
MAKKVLIGVLLTILAFSFTGTREIKGNPFYNVPFKQVVLEQPPLEAEGHILVAAQEFFSLMGGSVDWYRNRGVLRGKKAAVVTVGSPTAEIDGTTRRLETAPVLVDDRLYIPLTLALEVLDQPGRGDEDTYLPSLQGGKGLHFRYYPVYDLQASYDPNLSQLAGRLFLAYQNPNLLSLEKLYFNLPANAPYGKGSQITVSRVSVNNRPVTFNTKGSTLEVFLPAVLAPQETIFVAISFTTKIQDGASGRLGRTGATLMAAGWYPILAPYVAGSWQGMASAYFGEPYFAGSAYYRVRLTVPTGYRVLASGRETGKWEEEGQVIWTFNSDQPIREFAFTAAAGWDFITRQAGPVQLVMAARDEPAMAALEAAERALDFFQRVFGTYPYSYLHLAFVPLDDLAGMEYPGFIIISNRKGFNPATVVHEVAHQWWYNLVGNDSVRSAWIDEGLAEYSTLMFYRNFNTALYQTKLDEIKRLGALTGQPVDLSLEEYGDEQAYRRAVYNRGALFWLEMEQAVGGEVLRQALSYIQRYYRYEILTQKALLTILKYYGATAFNFHSYLRN